jgi:hypothetical protein
MLQVEISKTYGMQEWRDDLRKVLKMAGEENKKVLRTACLFCMHQLCTTSARCVQLSGYTPQQVSYLTSQHSALAIGKGQHVQSTSEPGAAASGTAPDK